ncbi:MAG: DsrE family protein [Acidobacteria bacterium]|nr:DsrE family protein [Acidobacteriota bacterium]
METKIVLLVTREGLGQVQPQDREFGLAMFEKFLHTLESQPEKPAAICFYTEGVRLVCAGSPVVPALQLLAGMGVRLIACESCLVQYGLRDAVRVGTVGGMKEIVAELLSADRVVTL